MKKILFLLCISLMYACSSDPRTGESYYDTVSEKDRDHEATIITNVRYDAKKGVYILDKAKINYSIVDSLRLFQGDIIINPIYEAKMRELKSGVGMEFFGRPYRKWPNGVVHYSIDESLNLQAPKIRAAMKMWTDQISSIKFDEEKVATTNHVMFKVNKGYASEVGMSGELQLIYLPSSPAVGKIAHEIGHALGLWHEHSRADRNKYVRINPQHISEIYKRQFDQVVLNDTTTFNLPYDYGSIMHYGKFDFNKNGKPTIEPIRPSSASIGQRNGPSEDDIKGLKKMYH